MKSQVKYVCRYLDCSEILLTNIGEFGIIEHTRQVHHRKRVKAEVITVWVDNYGAAVTQAQVNAHFDKQKTLFPVQVASPGKCLYTCWTEEVIVGGIRQEFVHASTTKMGPLFGATLHYKVYALSRGEALKLYRQYLRSK